MGIEWGKGKERHRTSEAYWKEPLTWDRSAAKRGVRERVFCASLADVFDPEVPKQWYLDLAWLISQTRSLDWLLLTKRPELARLWWHPPHVWIGTSIEDQKWHNRRIKHFKHCQGGKRFLSVEPLLGPITLDLSGINWVIVGGESQEGARSMNQDWARSIRDQCKAAGVAFWLKQMGGHPDKHDRLDDLPPDLQIRELP